MPVKDENCPYEDNEEYCIPPNYPLSLCMCVRLLGEPTNPERHELRKSLCTVHREGGRTRNRCLKLSVCVKKGRKKLGIRQAPTWGGIFSAAWKKGFVASQSRVAEKKRIMGGWHLPK